MNKGIKIYLADDHKVLIDGIKVVLESDPDFECVGFSLNGINLIEQVIESGANILIMDISMPKKAGWKFLKNYP